MRDLLARLESGRILPVQTRAATSVSHARLAFGRFLWKAAVMIAIGVGVNLFARCLLQ